MIKHARRQRGLTLISWMFIFAIAGFLGLMLLKLIPVYIEHFNVASSVSSLASDADLQGKSPSVLRDGLVKRLQINEVRNVHPEDILIARNGGVYEVTVDYEVVVPFVYNISFLVSFVDVAEVPVR